MLWILLTWGTAENIQALYAQKIVKKGLDLFLKPSDITILFIMVAGGWGRISCLCFWQMLIRMVSILFVCLGN